MSADRRSKAFGAGDQGLIRFRLKVFIMISRTVRFLHPPWAVVISLTTICIAVGCSGTKPIPVEQGVVVRGKVLKGGKPIVAQAPENIPGYDEMELVEISLVPLEGGAEEHPAGDYYGDYDTKTGDILFNGLGEGVPAGRYTLIVSLVNEMPASDDPDEALDGDAESDAFGGKFDAENSPFTITVPKDKVGGEFSFGTLDLEKPPS